MKQLIHCIGIGGIGISALARYYAAKGARVSGSDRADSDLLNELRSEGIIVDIGHAATHVPRGVDRVVYSAAVHEDNPEMQEARARGIAVMSYPEALGELTKQYITLAVSGAHGKSTTTALLALMLIKAGLDPTVIIGTRLAEFGGKNMRKGKSRYLVIEADEWNRSFFHYAPSLAIITNVNKEHLDTYGTLQGVVSAFRQYVGHLPSVATVIVNAQDKNSIRAARGASCRTVFFNETGKRFTQWPLQIPGFFNQLNAEAAWRAARILGVKRGMAVSAVRDYQGSWRRMEPLTPHRFTEGEALRGTFFSDYAHHPNEIRATIGALREKYPRRKLLIIFEPHQRERLTHLFNDFVTAFDTASQVGILPVYQVAGRESDTGKTSEDLVYAIKKNKTAPPVSYLKNFAQALTLIKGQVVIFMGAGALDTEVRKYFTSKLLPM